MEQKQCPVEFITQFRRCFELLSKRGIHFSNNDESKLKKYWRLLYLVPFVVIFNWSTFSFMTKINSETDDVYEVGYMVCICVVTSEDTLIGVIILYKRADIEKLLNELGSIWRTSNLTDVQLLRKKHLLKRLNWCQSMFYWINIFGTWLHLFTPLVLTLIRRFILGQDCDLKLPFGGVFPYDPKKSWLTYLPTYAFQAFTLFNEVCIYIGTEFLKISLCANLAIEFTLLNDDLIHVLPTSENDGLYRHSLPGTQGTSGTYTSISIQEFVKRHQKLLGMAKQLDDTFNLLVFVSFVSINFKTCLFGFSTVTGQGVVERSNNLVGVIALLMAYYMFCYYGELLQQRSLDIADAAYANNWYKGDIQYQKIIVFIIARSQRPCCMTALKYVPITLSTFSKMLGTTWSYLSLLTTVYLNDE